MSDPEDILSYLDIESFSQNRAEEIRTEIIRFIRMHWIDNEEESAKETNNNPNFMQEKDMKYNLYPFYINWKKIEERKNSFYDTFAHLGYFGAAVFSNFKTEECPINLTYKNIIFTFSTLCYEFLTNTQDKEKAQKSCNKVYTYPKLLYNGKISHKRRKRQCCEGTNTPYWNLMTIRWRN